MLLCMVNRWIQSNSKGTENKNETTTILGVISPYGIANISVRRPKAPLTSKKKKIAIKTRSTYSFSILSVVGENIKEKMYW